MYNDLREIVWSQIIDMTTTFNLYPHKYFDVPESFVDVWNLQEAAECFALNTVKHKHGIPKPIVEGGFLRWGAWEIAKGEKEVDACLKIIDNVVGLAEII